jgi:hypothetical protein
LHQGCTSGQVDGSQFHNIPAARSFAKAVPYNAVAAQSRPDVESRAVHIDCQSPARDGKVSDGNGRLSIGWRHGDLFIRMEAMLLEQA